MSDSSSRTPWSGSAFPAQFFLWPLIAASEVVAAQAGGFARLMVGAEPDKRPKPEWTTPNRVRLVWAALSPGLVVLRGQRLNDTADGISFAQTSNKYQGGVLVPWGGTAQANTIVDRSTARAYQSRVPRCGRGLELELD